MSFFYLLSGASEEREVAGLELWALSGVEADETLGEGPLAVDLSGAAYVRCCARTLAAGVSLEDLAEAVRAADLSFDGFRIEVYRPGPRVPETRTQVARCLADAIGGRPNLDAPRVRLVALAQNGRWRLGTLVSESSRDWELPRAGVSYSAALPAQMARALVNLVAAPGDVLVDPCCGLGTVVAQAARRGLTALGVEISRKLAGQAAEFVRGVEGRKLIAAGDARRLGGRFDAAVVDLPYGRATQVPPGLYEELLANLADRVDRAVVVSAEPLEELLAAAGFRLLRAARAISGGLTRHVHLVAPVRQ